jgi:DNA-binding NarL/FixJ family response regulator
MSCERSRPDTVLVADDHTLARDGMKVLVAGVLTGVRFAEAHDGASLFGAARANPAARLGMVDLRMPGMQGGFRLLQFARLHPRIPLVVVSASGSPEVARRIMNIHSVYAFMPKSSGADALRAALDAALCCRKYVPTESRGDASHPVVTLTPRQEEILRLVRQGMTNKMIAIALGISPGTVKNHVHEIFKLLNARNRMQAAHASSAVEW